MSDKIVRYHYTDPMEYVDTVMTYGCKLEGNKVRYDRFSPRGKKAAQALKEHNFESKSAMIHGIVKELKTVNFSLAKWKFLNRMVTGSRVDIGRYLEGRQDCWGGFRRQAKAKRTVRVYTQTGGNRQKSKEKLAVSGAVAVTITDILESMGVDMELWVCEAGEQFLCGSNPSLNKFVSCVRVKSSNQFADLGMVNFFSGDEDFFRGVGFLNIIMIADKANEEVIFTLGKHRNIDAELIGLDEYEKAHSIIIPSIYDINVAKQYLKDLINNKLETMKRS